MLKEYSGNAPATRLSAQLLSGTTSSFTVLTGGGAGYPTGGTAPFVVTLDRGTALEEKVLVSARSGDTFTIAASGRGYDNTSAQTHASQAVVEHTIDAVSLSEASQHINDDTRDDHSQYLNATRHNADAHDEQFPLGVGAWTSYVPTLTAATINPTLGTGSNAFGRYTRIGRTIIGIASIRFGTSGINNGSGEYHVSLPVAGVIAADNPDESLRVVGPAVLNESGSQTKLGVAAIWAAGAGGSGSYVTISLDSGNSPVSSSNPFSWGTEDSLWIHFMYEAAT